MNRDELLRIRAKAAQQLSVDPDVCLECGCTDGDHEDWCEEAKDTVLTEESDDGH